MEESMSGKQRGLGATGKMRQSSLVEDIKSLCARTDRMNVENILLIGKSGAGKSALVNTLIKTITGKFYERAKVGKGDAQSKTLHIVKYEHCGVRPEDLKHGSSLFTEDEVNRLPHVFDVPGLGDSREAGMEEMLRLLIAGRFPAGTGIPAIESLQKKHGDGNLDVIFDKVYHKINKIVFVQSAGDTVPSNLVGCLQSVLQETDPSTCEMKYTGDVFLVITHYDQVKVEEEVCTLQAMDDGTNDDVNDDVNNFKLQGHRAHKTTSTSISQADITEKENNLAKLFCISGAMSKSSMHWTSFCDVTGYDNPEICIQALEFLRFMIAPSTPVMPPTEVVVDITTWLKIGARQLRNYCYKQDALTCIAIGIAFLAIVMVFYMCVSAPVTKQTNQSHD